MDKALDISRDAQWLLPAREVILVLLPCAERGERQEVRISLTACTRRRRVRTIEWAQQKEARGDCPFWAVSSIKKH